MNFSGILLQLNRARRLVTGPFLGGRNVFYHLPAIYYFAHQYKIDPELVMAIVY